MASAVPIELRILASEDAVLRVEPATGEPVSLVIDRRVDPVTYQALLDVCAALDMAFRYDEETPPHAPHSPPDR
jgi:hypothetical protein